MHLAEIQEAEASDSKRYFPHLKEGPLYLGIALAGETGEVCNKIKKWARDDWSVSQLREEVKDELADVLIYLVMLADHLGIELEEEYHDKKDFNNDRYLKEI